MSIPGLGQLPIKSTVVSVRRTITLHPYWEWRFKVAHDSSVSVRVVSGSAERDGTELALNRPYRFKGALSKINTLFGCELEVEGDCERQHVAQISPDSESAIVQPNLHFLLANLRNDAKAGKNFGVGPRIMVVGPNNVGKTTLARTLAARAVKVGSQPQVVNLDPREGMLSLPGTLTAATFATMMDVEGTGGWGGTPTSGPSSVPVKLPLVYYYGRQHATDDVQLYREVASNLASAVTKRMSTNAEAKVAGIIIDTPGVSLQGELAGKEMDILAHIVEEFSVNMVVVLGSKDATQAVAKRFHGDKTSLGDQTNVIGLNKPDGVVDKDEAWLVACQHAAIKEYFFGDSKTTLNPSTQLLDIDSVTIYRTPEPTDPPSEQRGLEKVEPTTALSHWTMPIMNSKVGDAPEAIRTANVLGFVYIADVNNDRRKINILAPTSGRDPNQPLLLGSWPEQYINLLG